MSIELDFIKEMFDSIAPKYDFLNRFLSMGQDILWREKMVSSVNLSNGAKVLDIACGTCDAALEIKRQKGDNIQIFGTDFSPKMLFLGKKKINKNIQCNTNVPRNANIISNSSIHLAGGNALLLPFKNNTFDAVFIAFGIRNIMDRKAALKEFYRVLNKGGTLAILELTSPPEGIFRDIYLLYFKRILPAVGAVFSKNAGAYHYLPASVLNFPTPEKFALLLIESGFNSVKWKRMTFGIVTLFTGQKA